MGHQAPIRDQFKATDTYRICEQGGLYFLSTLDFGERVITRTNAIFLSYSSDDKEAALRLCEALKNAGLEVWIDQSELRSGDAWDQSIRQRIKECSVFVPMISASTQAREEGYFRLEWKLAIDRSYLMADDRAFLFPVVIDDTSEQSARVPERFRERQCTRLADDKQIQLFAEQLGRLLLDEPGLSAPSPVVAASQNEKRPTESFNTSTDGFWIAVLPFKHRGVSPEIEALADGISEDIVTGLSRFSYLRVMSHSSTSGVTEDTNDPRSVGRALNARYVMQGNLRQAGSALRISVQLVEAATGAHLWAENYNRTFSPDAMFELQDELVPRIVSTVADQNGVLTRSMSEAVRDCPPDALSPYEAVLRGFGYYWRLTAEECLVAQQVLELVLQKSPNYADAWAMLALLYGQAHAQRFDPDIDFLSKCVTAARRAVEAAPSNHMTHYSLAQALYFNREFESFRNSALRTAELNPMDGNAIAFMGELLSYAGDLERGKELASAAKQLNPNHPGWYWFTDFYHFYLKQDYRKALSCALKIELPEHWGTFLALAAAYGQLGDTAAGEKTLKQLLALRPHFAATARVDLERWFGPEYTAHLIEGLTMAGLDEL